MRRFPATSFSRLLALSFGLVLLLLGVLGIAIWVWQSQSATAQREFLERITPLAQRTDQLERSTLRYAIAGRSYLMNPTRERLNQFRNADAEVNAALAHLARQPKEADSELLTRQIAIDLRAYLAEGGQLVARHPNSPVDHSEESHLAAMREHAMQTLQRLSDLQRGKTSVAIATMQAARDRVSSGIIAALLIGGLLSVSIAWVTVQSIRRPVNELVAIAGELASGNWKPALQLATADRAPGEPESGGEMRRLARAIGSAAVALEQREQRLQSQNEELQSQHAEIQTQNARLKHQAHELAQADERKTRFLAVLAHELRNPMAPISNSLLLLRRCAPGSDQAQRAQAMIERQSKHLIRLIDDLLDITRISQGKIRLQREALDLGELLRACIEDQEASFGPGERHISLALPPQPLRVNGDRTRLAQIAGNLLSNAVKFTDRGGHIAVDLRVAEAGDAVHLTVSDDGMGFEAELAARLFEPFEQGAQRADRAHSGLGLGLSLVRSLAQLHGGTVSAYSDGVQRGARFEVLLPLLSNESARG